jgi:glutaconyl-CoA/methylmalonyl-CoA decarboxylase subunit gamma
MSLRKFKINIEGKSFIAEVEEIGVSSGSAAPVEAKTKASPVATMSPVAPAAGNAIVAPMPGKIISVKVQKGQQIKTGDVVIILEAMKMEQEIRSSLEGTVADIPVGVGDTVKKEQALIVVS